MRKVLLLNPPGREKYCRDYYCSKVSKADYLYHPVDLLILSGWLHGEFKLHVLDCIAAGIGISEARERILNYQPDAIVFLTGGASKLEDFRFLAEMKPLSSALMVGSGDCLLDEFDTLAEEAPWLDGAILDFTTDDTLRFIRAALNGDTYDGSLVVDLRDRRVVKPLVRENGSEFSIPVPRYELFPNERYSYPFVESRPFASVLTDYGCPYRCRFCVMSTLGAKLRPVENIVEELNYVHSLGMRSVYFVDQTFGYHRRRLKQLCEEIIARRYGFRWVAFSRADIVDEESLALMKESGCTMLMFGVESSLQRVLDDQLKDITLDEIRRGFSLCAKLGIKTLATFIVGLPGVSYQETLGLLDFAIELKASYASFNVLVPRVGSPIRSAAKQENWIVRNDGTMDQSGSYAVMDSDTLSADEILQLRNKLVRGFFFRPNYLVERLLELRTPYAARSAVRNGRALLRQIM